MIYGLDSHVQTELCFRINARIRALQINLESKLIDHDNTQFIRGQLRELRLFLDAKPPTVFTTQE